MLKSDPLQNFNVSVFKYRGHYAKFRLTSTSFCSDHQHYTAFRDDQTQSICNTAKGLGCTDPQVPSCSQLSVFLVR